MRTAELLKWILFLVLVCMPDVVAEEGETANVEDGSTPVFSEQQTTSADGKPVEGVVVMTSANFGTLLSDGNKYLIKFYAPWCSHCMNFVETYEEIALHFHADPTQKVRVAKVDTTEEKALGQRFNVNAYPSFFLVDGSSVYEFEGQRSKATLIQFATVGYKEQPSIPFWTSPMGPLGRLQGFLIWGGTSMIAFFEWFQEKSGLSPLLAGICLCGSVVFGGLFSMIFLVIALTPREKVD